MVGGRGEGEGRVMEGLVMVFSKQVGVGTNIKVRSPPLSEVGGEVRGLVDGEVRGRAVGGWIEGGGGGGGRLSRWVRLLYYPIGWTMYGWVA